MPWISRWAQLIVGGWLCATCAPLGAAVEEHAFYHENVMGTSLELRVRAEDATAARRAEDRVLGAIDRLAAIFSRHDPASELRRWQATAMATFPAARPTPISPELFEVLRECDHWRARR